MEERKKIDIVVLTKWHSEVTLHDVTDKEQVGDMINFCGSDGFIAEFPIDQVLLVMEKSAYSRYKEETKD